MLLKFSWSFPRLNEPAKTRCAADVFIVLRQAERKLKAGFCLPAPQYPCALALLLNSVYEARSSTRSSLMKPSAKTTSTTVSEPAVLSRHTPWWKLIVYACLVVLILLTTAA